MQFDDRVLYILLDTNFLIVPFQFRINLKSKFDELIDREYKLVLLQEIYDELLRINKKARGKSKQEIQAAITYYRNHEKVSLLKRNENEPMDEFIIRVAKKYNMIVATNDRSLKRRLKNQGINFIYLRQGSYLKSHRPLG
ncbi:MAG: type II toxin-antitoxin system VapC family toxin [Candidatus Helarchaeota archaeon]